MTVLCSSSASCKTGGGRSYFIPTRFSGEELLTIFGGHDSLILLPEKLDYLVSLILRKMVTDEDSPFAGEAILNAKILKSKIRDYKAHLDYLEEMGIIDIYPHSEGRYSKRYKLREEHLSGVRSITLPDSIFVQPRSKKSSGQVKHSKTKKGGIDLEYPETRSVVKDRTYNYLNKWFNPSLTIDMSRAVQIATEMAGHPEGKYFSAKFSQNCDKARAILRSDPVLKVDGYGKRYYSPVTELPNKKKMSMRHLLRYDGHPLHSIDVRSSLPYILGLFLYNIKDQEIPGSKISTDSGLIKEAQKIIYPYSRVKKSHEENCPLVVGGGSGSSPSPTGRGSLSGSSSIKMHDLTIGLDIREIERYLEAVCSGDIYASFAESLKAIQSDYLFTERFYDERSEHDPKRKKYIPAREFFIKYDPLIDPDRYDRNAAKGMFVRILSGEECKDPDKDKLYFKVFRESFPTIAQFLRNLKNIGGAENRHKCSSQLLQRLESYLILEVIAKEFVREHKDIPIYTIHDNLATLESHWHILQNKAEEVFTRYCPTPPEFHDEEWFEEM